MMAQKKNYFSIETGAYFGSANDKIMSSMKLSGLGDLYQSGSGWLDILLGLGSVDTQYPHSRTGKLKYRIRAGRYLSTKNALEAGYGLSYYGSVSGYDKLPSSNYANRLWIQTWIHNLYAAFLVKNEGGTAGIGGGPALSFYKQVSVGNGNPEQTSHQLLPGGILCGFWNFYSEKTFYVGLRSECSLTRAGTTGEIKVTNSGNPSFVSVFKATKTGAVNGSVTLTAGLKF